jgi:nucleoside-diphosphate-sugar epimerase
VTSNPATTTLIGGAGFIGGALAARLRSAGVQVDTPARDADLRGKQLGTLLYCAGVTGDFRSRPGDTIEAHVTRLSDLLHGADVERVVYLSSARMYRYADSTAEDAVLRIAPGDPDQLYDLSKVLGEAICAVHPNAVAARLSHVFGNEPDSPNFLSAMVRAAVGNGVIRLSSAAASTRDYVGVHDVVDVLDWLRGAPVTGLLNIASGTTVRHADLVAEISRLTGAALEVEPDAPMVLHPAVDISRLRGLRPDFRPRSVLDEVAAMVRRAGGTAA